MGQLAETLIARINPDAKIVSDEQRIRPEKSEVIRLLGDNRLITELTGWEPRFDLEGGLDATIEWFRTSDHMQGYKADIYNV